MKALKILALVHPDCVPPNGAGVRDAEWADWKTEFYVQRSLKKLGHQVELLGVADSLEPVQHRISEFQPDLVFNLLEEFHGEPSFESHVVAYLELLGIPYTGCNPQGLALGRDKALSKKILQYHGVPTPSFFTVDIGKSVYKPDELNFPFIVKSLNEEASLGISQDSVVRNIEKLKARVEFIHQAIGTTALVEEYIEGREFYVGVLGNKNLKVLPPWELEFGNLVDGQIPIATRNVKFNKDYCERHKIKRGLARDLTPFVLKRAEKLSRAIFRALKMSGYARMDFRLTADNHLYFLEANPNPELANGECLANAAQHSGLKYDQLIAKILQMGLKYERAA